MAFNRELAERVLAHIETLPTGGAGDVWDQGCWHAITDCGTTACFAGWTVILANHSVSLGQQLHISETAATLLGIKPGGLDAYRLFYAENSLEDISLAIKRLAERDGV